MSLVLYLNKYLRLHYIDNYTIQQLMEMITEYKKNVEDNEGVDIEFPEFKFS